MREAFRRHTQRLLGEEQATSVLAHQLKLSLHHYSNLEGAPSQVVNQLALEAFNKGFDYIYQVNDDTSMVTPNWATELIVSLRNNPVQANFGVTGPLDTNNDKIFTHAFVHRTHVEIFGGIFPEAFKNWWSDDWISTVYGSTHTFHPPNVQITHNVGSKKTGDTTRYEVDHAAQLVLEKELLKGHSKINQWLASKNLPALPVPNICGFAPALSLAEQDIVKFIKGSKPSRDAAKMKQ